MTATTRFLEPDGDEIAVGVYVTSEARFDAPLGRRMAEIKARGYLAQRLERRALLIPRAPAA